MNRTQTKSGLCIGGPIDGQKITHNDRCYIVESTTFSGQWTQDADVSVVPKNHYYFWRPTVSDVDKTKEVGGCWISRDIVPEKLSNTLYFTQTELLNLLADRYAEMAYRIRSLEK